MTSLTRRRFMALAAGAAASLLVPERPIWALDQTMLRPKPTVDYLTGEIVWMTEPPVHLGGNTWRFTFHRGEYGTRPATQQSPTIEIFGPDGQFQRYDQATYYDDDLARQFSQAPPDGLFRISGFETDLDAYKPGGDLHHWIEPTHEIVNKRGELTTWGFAELGDELADDWGHDLSDV